MNHVNWWACVNKSKSNYDFPDDPKRDKTKGECRLRWWELVVCCERIHQFLHYHFWFSDLEKEGMVEGDVDGEGEFWKVEWLWDWWCIYSFGLVWIYLQTFLCNCLKVMCEGSVVSFVGWRLITLIDSEFKLNKEQIQEGKLTEGDFELGYEAMVQVEGDWICLSLTFEMKWGLKLDVQNFWLLRWVREK